MAVHRWCLLLGVSLGVDKVDIQRLEKKSWTKLNATDELFFQMLRT